MRAVRQRDADLVAVLVEREREDPVAGVEPSVQAPQVEALRIARRRNRTRRKAFDLELRKCAADVGEKPWPVGGGRRAEQLDRRGKLRVTAIDRRIGLVRPAGRERSP